MGLARQAPKSLMELEQLSFVFLLVCYVLHFLLSTFIYEVYY